MLTHVKAYVKYSSECNRKRGNQGHRKKNGTSMLTKYVYNETNQCNQPLQYSEQARKSQCYRMHVLREIRQTEERAKRDRKILQKSVDH